MKVSSFVAFLFPVLALLAFLCIFSHSAFAQTAPSPIGGGPTPPVPAFTMLHSFSGWDGDAPGPLIQASDGFFYGTTGTDETQSGHGTIFKMDMQGNITTLHTFIGIDGLYPSGPLIQAKDGLLYGVTQLSSSSQQSGGEVFRTDTSGNVTVMHTFSGLDGLNPEFGLAMASNGTLYGTTVFGGLNNKGTIFQIDTSGNFQVLYSFSGQADGAQPECTPAIAPDGSIYGTTWLTANSNPTKAPGGTVWRIGPQGTFSTIHSFTGLVDGSAPIGGVTIGPDGSLYGTTAADISTGVGDFAGTIYKIDPSRNFTTLYKFAEYNGAVGANPYGETPEGPLTFGSDGLLYGMCITGAGTVGTIYRTDTNGNMQVVYDFSGFDGLEMDDCVAFPLITGNNGDLYGVTPYGGDDYSWNGSLGYGTVYRLGAASPAPPSISSLSPGTVVIGSTATILTVQGMGFDVGAMIDFGNTAVPSNFLSNQTINCLIPAGVIDAIGMLPVVVDNGMGSGKSPTASLVVVGPPPTISAFSPTSGSAGTTVKIVGQNLSNATSVTFNGAATTTLSGNTATQLLAVVPNASIGSGVITVTTPDGIGVSSAEFTVTITPAPTITGFSPMGGPDGTVVQVYGTNLSDPTVVTVNNVTVTSYSVTNATQMQITIPNGAGTGPIAITTPGGTATSSSSFTVMPSPTISTIAPVTGPIGTSVTITGTALANATSVTFGGIAATSITSDTATQIIAIVPPTAPADSPVAVSTLGGTATSPTDFTVTPVPTIASVAPLTGPVGTSVTIIGTNLSPETHLTFNGISATSITQDVSSQIVCVVPAGATTGPVAVTTQYGIATSPANFVVIPMPTITSVSPASAEADASVTIDGTGLANATSITFGGVAATNVGTDTSTQISVTVPAGVAVGACTVTVTTAGGTATNTTAFTVLQTPMPSISALTPVSGPVGTSVTITGANLANASVVSFNSTSATSITSDSAGRIICVVPQGASTGPIAVTTPGGTAEYGAGFTVVQPPTITTFAPTGAGIGTTVTISGAGLANATSVTFNGTPATNITADSSTQITVQVPNGATTGLIAVTTIAGTASTTTFTVIPAPVVAGFTPATGPAGTIVLITGTNLSNATRVLFNGLAASTTSGNTDTQIEAVVPAGATSGVVSVVSLGGTGTSATSFTVIPPPIITSFSPGTGPVGTTVTINGSGLANAVAVTFFGTAATKIISETASVIVADVPAGATTGVVAVRTIAGTTANTATFTVIPAPIISGLSPSTSPVGSPITITGTGLANALSVTFNGVQAPTADITSDTLTQIIATVPSGAPAGAGEIVVTTAGGVASSPTNFTVIPLPSINAVSPSGGAAGTVVTITGSGLANAITVTFGGISATTITSDSAGKIIVVVPSGAVSGKIEVTTSGGSANSPTTFAAVPAPVISSVSPGNGAAGTLVTITGSGLSNVTSIQFGGVAATQIDSNTDTLVSVVVPVGAASGAITITDPGGVTTSTVNFTVLPTPSITGLSPTSVVAGSIVTIEGSGLGAETSVLFNGTAATTISSDTATKIVVAVPSGTTSGTVSVTTAGGTATSPVGFTVVQPPTIASFNPAAACVGTSVTISGANLNNATVQFNGIAATSISSDTSGQILVLVPGGATTGPLTVTTVAGPAISATSFIVTQSPSISGVSPCICATGATVQINGANLANVLSVTFGGVAVTDIISYSATRVTVVVPTGAVSGDVVVTTGSGTATSTAAFTLAPVHTFPAGLAMISVPADYSAQAISETLGLASPVLAIWNPATFAYDATPSPDVATLAVGRAYWARLPQGASINSIGNATPTTTPFLITLQAGWNMIGDPFPIDEPLTGITVNGSGGAAQSIASATDSGLIGSGVWAYNGSAYSQATALSPYQGYWVYTTTSCTLSVPPPAIQLGPFVSGSH